MTNISILGVTGSIGTQTLDVLRKEKENFKLIGITANTNVNKILEIIDEFNPKYVAMMDKIAYEKLKEHCIEIKKDVEVLFGLEGLNYVATISEVDIIVTSIVGMVGLVPTIKAIRAGKKIALANKETLVVGGELVIEEARKYNSQIIPVDSEHGAIFQCLQGNNKAVVNKIILTASGGPFRGKNTGYLRQVTVDDALKHPKWNMGKKISIDSATLMNKGLEVIEAHWLFNINYNNIDVVIHPQSVIHSMVEYIDGSVIAQMACTDMKLPIQYAINYPERKFSVVDRLNFYKMGNLTFERPDMDTFRCLRLAYEAGKAGGIMPTVLNASNEVAVELFLNRKIEFLDIQFIVEEALNKFEFKKILDLETILNTDKEVRNFINNKYLI